MVTVTAEPMECPLFAGNHSKYLLPMCLIQLHEEGTAMLPALQMGTQAQRGKVTC